MVWRRRRSRNVATHQRAGTLATILLALVCLLPAAPAAAVEVQRVISPGGIEAWLVEDHSNPILSLELSFRGGGALDPADKVGLANMVSGLIDEGAGPLDSQAFQGQLENLSIRLRFNAGLDTFGGSLRTLTENRETAFEMLRLALTEPRFDAEPVERIRAQLLARLRSQENDPNMLASRAFRRLMFAEHPYARQVDGTETSVKAIETADLKRFVAERFARANLKVGVVGDITADELSALLDETFGALPAEPAPGVIAEIAAQAAGDLIVIEQDVPQSSVVLGHGGMKRDNPDYYTAYVVNYILGGGGFASRLYEEVRENRGLAYTVYSYLNALDHSGLVLGGVGTANARVAESIAVIREEWQRMAEQGPSAEELDAAKTYLTGSYPLRQTSSSRIAGMLVGIQLEELGIDYMDRRNGLIEAVTLEDAKRVAATLYQPEKLTVVVVGKPEGLEPTREAPGGS